MKRSIWIIAIVAFAVAATGCPDKVVAPPDRTITENDAAQIFAAAFGTYSGGYTMLLRDMVSVAHGGDIVTGAGKAPSRSALGVAGMRDTTIVRSLGVLVGTNRNYAINDTIHYLYGYTNAAYFDPQRAYYPGNTAMKSTPALTLKGTMNVPNLSAVDSAWVTFQMNHTDSTYYIMNGKFGRVGTYTFANDTGRKFIGTIETANLPGVTVDPVKKEIVDGDILVTLRGKDVAGNKVEWAGTYIFRIGKPPTLLVGNGTYTLLTDVGEAVRIKN